MNPLSNPFEELLITTVSDGSFFIGELFQRKYAHAAPEIGNHVVCFYRKNAHHHIPLAYLNFLLHDEIMLVGGGMTDGKTFAHIDGGLGERIRASGGMLFHMLRFGFDHFKDQCEAYYGHAGDKRAYEVDMRAGFEPTRYQHLIGHFHKPITLERKNYLTEKANDLGPF